MSWKKDLVVILIHERLFHEYHSQKIEEDFMNEMIVDFCEISQTTQETQPLSQLSQLSSQPASGAPIMLVYEKETGNNQ